MLISVLLFAVGLVLLIKGGDWFVDGSRHDYDSIKAGLEAGTVTREQLRVNATRVLNMAKKLCK